MQTPTESGCRVLARGHSLGFRLEVEGRRGKRGSVPAPGGKLGQSPPGGGQQGWRPQPPLTSTFRHSTAEEFTHRASNVLSVPKWHCRAVSCAGETRAELQPPLAQLSAPGTAAAAPTLPCEPSRRAGPDAVSKAGL